MTATLLYIPVLCLLSLLIDGATAVWPFPPKRFTGNSLLEAGTLGITQEGRIVAFGDFNGDQFIDILTLGADDQTLTVHLWDHESFSYEKLLSFHHPKQVHNVFPGDFTYDGTVDLLVVSKGTSSNQLDMALYVGTGGGVFDSNTISIPSSTLSQVIPLDADGDLKIDLLGMTTDSRSLRLWRNVWNTSSPNPQLFELIGAPLSGPQCSISNPHSNAVVDLNGDCLADVFLVCDGSPGKKTYQIWLNNGSKGFELAQSGELPKGIQSVSFADMNRDGTIDIVILTCGSVSSTTGVGNDCAINIAYNYQIPLCTNTADNGIHSGKRTCRPPQDLCTADPNFRLSFTSGNAYEQIPVSKLFPSSSSSASSSLLVMDVTASPSIPLPLKLGDANLDGFPDFLFISATSNPGSTFARIPRIALSIPCSKGIAGCENRHANRGWQTVLRGTELLATITDTRSVSFVDIDEDGSLDIMIQRTNDQNDGNILFIQNNFFYDAFFLKAIVLNGACDNSWCTNNNGTRYRPFGVSFSGASFKYTVLDPSRRRSAAQVAQLPQTAYQTLLTPYAFFGLGRTNNYIENLFVGSSLTSSSSSSDPPQHFINMEGVIPNSKVLVSPPSKERFIEGSRTWRKELYLRPGSWIPWVTVTVVATTVVLAIVVFVLHMNEKREDNLERRKASLRINFDAL